MTTLDSALSGLNAAQQQITTISNNISNASVTGYTRKVLPLQTVIVNGNALGVAINDVVRHVDNALISDVNTQTSISAAYDIRQTYMDRIQSLQGAANGGFSLSAQVAALASNFSTLSQSPSDTNLQSQVINSAQQTAHAINNYSNLLTNMRTQSETDISAAINTVNTALDSIAQLNMQIERLASSGQSTADLQDQRDTAINTVAQYLQITTFNSGNQATVMTKRGDIMVDSTAHHLFFQSSTIAPTSYYPGGGLNGLFLGGSGPPAGTDITQTNLNGQLGALFQLRDQTIPQYTAQLDEFSQKLASRFQSEGLTLFTDNTGAVPPNVAPPGPVGYVGFSSLIQVNNAIVQNPQLLVNGTTGNTELPGSNQVIDRVNQNVFGTYQSQLDTGTVDITFGGAMTPLVAGLGLVTNNRLIGNVNLGAVGPDFTTLPGATLPGSFNLTLGGVTHTITVLPTDTANTLANNINTAFGGTPATINGQGNLELNFSGQIQIANNTIGAPTMAALGFNFGIYPDPNPSFQVQVGTRNPVTISIAPGDTAATLLAKLNMPGPPGVPGLTASLNGGGQLVMKPTDGGNLTLTDISGTALAAMGITSANVPWTNFRQNNLGPDATLSTGLAATSTLQDYANSIISVQSQANSLNKGTQAQETAYLQALQTRNSNTSGVNIDQEMSNLIQVQQAYTAAAKMIESTQKMMDALLGSIQ